MPEADSGLLNLNDRYRESGPSEIIAQGRLRPIAGVREIDWAQGVAYTYRVHYENIGAVSKERKSRSNRGQSTVFTNIRINCALPPAFPVNNSRGWYEHQS